MTTLTKSILDLIRTLPNRDDILKEIAIETSENVYLTAEEVADRFKVSITTINNWRNKGLLKPSLNIPYGTTRYSLSKVLDFERKYHD